jgi:hypothetical protein
MSAETVSIAITAASPYYPAHASGNTEFVVTIPVSLLKEKEHIVWNKVCMYLYSPRVNRYNDNLDLDSDESIIALLAFAIRFALIGRGRFKQYVKQSCGTQ